MTTVIAPEPYASFGTVFPSGSVYTADAVGIITGVALQDLEQLRQAGCEQVGLGGATTLLGRLLGANMNVTTDQAIAMFQPAGMPYRPTRISARNASISLTTAVGGVYPAVSKGGTALVANSQVYSALTAGNINLDLTLAVGTIVQPAGTPLYLSLTSAQGAAATADFFVYGELML